MIIPDWIFLTVTIVLGLFGLWLFYWSLLRDRSRGRRRCPKCWYDLAGTPGNLTCSECGYVARRERRFFKTRRRWRWAFLSALLLIIAAGTALFPAARSRGLETIVPTTVLVLMAPELRPPANVSAMLALFPTTAPANPPANPWATTAPATPRLVALMAPSWRYRLHAELMDRISRDRLWSWQWRLLVWRCWNDARPPWTVQLATRSAWADDDPVCIAPQISCNPSNYIWLEDGRYRVRIKPRIAAAGESVYHLYESDGPKPVTQATNPWRERLCLSQPLKPDVRSVECDIWMERCPAGGPAKSWRAVWYQCATVAIGRGGQDSSGIEAVHDPVIDDMVRNAVVSVDRAGIKIHWPLPPPSGPALRHPTLAIRFELQCDGKTAAVAHAWWSTNNSAEGLTVGPLIKGFPYTVRWDQPMNDSQFDSIKRGEKTWTLRTTGDATLALRDVRSSHCWAGEVSVPLSRKANADELLARR